MSFVSETPISNGAIFDAALELKDAGLVAASAAAQVDAADKVIEIGNGGFMGDIVIDVTAIEIASNDEKYSIVAQFSDTEDFSGTVVNGSILELGATEVLSGGASDSKVGRYTIPFSNKLNDVQYGYMRLYTEVEGSVATGINYSAFATKH